MESGLWPPRRGAVVVLAVAIALAGATACTSSLHDRTITATTFPPTPATGRPDGEKLFLNSCARCHGADARGDEGPDLHGLKESDGRITAIIQKGIKGEMPSFAKKHPPEDVAAIIAYLRTLK